MLSATRQLIEMLDEFDELQSTGESPSPAQIRDLFRVRDEARAEVDALAPMERRTEIEPVAETIDEFNQDAAASRRAGAVSSHSAEDTARGETVDAIDRIDASLQAAVAAGPKPPAKKARRATRKTKAVSQRRIA